MLLAQDRRDHKQTFLAQYRVVFDVVENAIVGIPDQNRLRLFTQQLFNRLMFIAFIQKKGWLSVEGSEPGQFLEGLWRDYLGREGNADGNFYRDRLQPIFLGELFEQSDDEPDAVVPDSAIDAILHQLLALFRFSPAERGHRLQKATPVSEVLRRAGSDGEESGSSEYLRDRRRLKFRAATEINDVDCELTIDPEMLGTVFEELVAGRHVSGSYYTPKPIVSFMCREAIKGYFRNRVPGESAEAIADFVDRHNPSELNDCRAVLDALRQIRVCDPACGSGAYLMGIMHELLDLRVCLSDGSENPVSIYDCKLEIIQTNLHGVDLDPFAVNIARMRLWLSLAVEYDGSRPPLLANLKFQITAGDSLVGGNSFDLGLTPSPPYSGERVGVRGDASSCAAGKMTPHPNPLPRVWGRGNHNAQGRADNDKFDIVIMNPPYVATYSRESEKAAFADESHLKSLYGSFGGRLNLFTCFIIRASQLLAPGGAAVFIVPDSYATSDSYAKVREEYVRRFPSQTWALVKLGLFGANVRNVIVCCTAGPKVLRTVTLSTQEDLDRLAHHSADHPVSVWGVNGRVNFFQSEFEQAVWVKLRRNTRVLAELFETRDGVNPGSRPTRDRLLLPQGGKKSPKLRPLIEGTQIDPNGFVIRTAVKTILYDPQWVTPAERKAGTSLRDPRIFDSPKIVSRQTADTLIAAIDLADNLVTLNSVHCTRSRLGNEQHLWGLLGLLNSPLARLFYAIDGGETRELLPQVHISWLRNFPLPENVEALFAELAPLARKAYESFEDEPRRADALGQIHKLVCSAYRLDGSDAEDALHAYLSRYPRFGSRAVGSALADAVDAYSLKHRR